MAEEWITVKIAAQIRKCSERNIIQLIKKGTLQAKKDGRRWLVLMDTSVKVPEDVPERYPNVPEMISILQKQLFEKDKQIENLQNQITTIEDARQRSDTIILQLTRQLEQSQRLLEYHQEPWYRKLFRKKRTEDLS